MILKSSDNKLSTSYSQLNVDNFFIVYNLLITC
nr:MAG TPA: hypothetical protein [Bacteriophage sp.]